MANRGQDFGQDFTFPVGASYRCATSTAQYAIVCGGSGTAAFQPDVPNTSTPNTLYPVGVIVSPMTTTSVDMTVRMLGVAAVRCGASVAAWDWLKAGFAASMMGYALPAVLSTATTLLTANVTQMGIVGQAIENGSTLQVIEANVRPYLSAQLS